MHPLDATMEQFDEKPCFNMGGRSLFETQDMWNGVAVLTELKFKRAEAALQ